MSPRSISEPVLREPQPLHVNDTIEQAVRQILASELPALPVLDEREHYAGIFGEPNSCMRCSPATSTNSRAPASCCAHSTRPWTGVSAAASNWSGGT